ncbi:hypothetical protein [Piscibacillus halophilus]|uniref:hypothetical protein n=1 Tax=Piscibacillus halophilus TaxID=571933 RepID=UPI002409D950|nr:hypothetical protein [Piscibacillus halophilus]
MSSKQYVAVTYDVCKVENLFEDMNHYQLEPSINMDEQVNQYAKQDIAPVVRVYEKSNANQTSNLYKEYHFKEYDCSCSSEN